MGGTKAELSLDFEVSVARATRRPNAALSRRRFQVEKPRQIDRNLGQRPTYAACVGI
jgi:hypothetical protein